MSRLECWRPDAPADVPATLVQVGPSVLVAVQAPALQDGVPPKTEMRPALIDTGATECHIDYDLARTLELPVIDKQTLSGVAGPAEHDVVLGTILIAELAVSINGRFVCVNLKGGGSIHEVILGRTFLNGCVMIYDGHAGHITILR